MTLTIGENLRKLRVSRELTQEQLSVILGVSAQAVSRWESGSVYPDLETLPGIANFFSVSLDELTGMDKLRENGNLHELFTRASTMRANGNVQDAIAELRKGLKLYPNNYGLLSELALTLTQAGNQTGEAIALSERVLAGSISNKLRSTTAANLVCLYLADGERDKASRLVSSLGHLWESREIIRTELAETDYREALRTSFRIMLALMGAKITGANSHIYGKPDTCTPNVLNFSQLPNDSEMLDIVAKFLSE